MEGLVAGRHNKGRVHPKGFQNCWLEGQAGLVGPADLEGRVASLASLQAGLGAREGSEGASPEVGHLVGLGVDHPEGPQGGYPEVQVVGNYHLRRREAALEEDDRLDLHGSLG